MMKVLSIGLVILVIFLSACSSANLNKIDIRDTVAPGSTAVSLPVVTLAPYPQINASYPTPDISGSNQVTSSYPIPLDKIDPKPPLEAPQPASGKASVSGVLVTLPTLSALPKTLFYLTLAVGEQKTAVPPILAGPDENKGDIAAYSDENGSFSLDNIPPGNYYLVVSFPNAIPVAQISAEDVQPLFITLKEGQRLALGLVYIPPN